ncbi:MAG: tRNA pseudouridine(55) synthase TruB [Actinomycetales bacterium]|nr:tRNA pseudouridine(55) synthase TruB [Actinomycetales bacterium]
MSLRPQPPDGLLVIDKPAGLTSHDVVARVRRVLGTRRVGHAGTLDPMATGVLLLGIGRATRLLGHLALQDKEYLATIRLGSATVTDDCEGEILTRAEPGQVEAILPGQIRQGMAELTGRVMQVPSAVSAIKVDGRRSHARVREGEKVQLAPRPVTVHALELLAERRMPGFVDLDVRVACSTGTYVRALARDLGSLLGVGGHLTALRRTRVGPWCRPDAVELAAWEQSSDPAAPILPMGQAARRSFPVVVLDESDAGHARHGRPIDWPPDRDEAVVALVDVSGELIALGERAGHRVRYLAVLAAAQAAGTP